MGAVINFKFLNNLGFSLVEVLIAMGISTGVALVVVKVMEESNKNQKTVENKDEVLSFSREVVNKLGDRMACFNTLAPDLKEGVKGINVKQVKDRNNNVIYPVPFSKGSVTLEEIVILDIDRIKETATAKIKFQHKVMGKTFSIVKPFTLELVFDKDQNFEGCVSSTGTVNMDPKEACDMVVGFDTLGNSYFRNASCDFARAACDRMGKDWDANAKDCRFSESDRLVIREEMCRSLGFTLAADKMHCEFSVADMQAIQKKMGTLKPAPADEELAPVAE